MIHYFLFLFLLQTAYNNNSSLKGRDRCGILHFQHNGPDFHDVKRSVPWQVAHSFLGRVKSKSVHNESKQ